MQLHNSQITSHFCEFWSGTTNQPITRRTESGEDFFNLDELLLTTNFFQHLDSTQESLVDAFMVSARDSSFIYSLERPGRGKISQIDLSLSPIEEKVLVLYPNPSSETLNVHLEGVSGSIRIVNLLGTRIYANEVFSGYTVVSLEHFNDGVYIIQIKDINGDFYRSTFIVAK